MRKAFCDSMVALAGREALTFLTGDLGFKALESLQAALGPRFINAGVSEQNMVSVAAGLARVGVSAWIYSIAPFCYARPFEQIRNDVCLNKLPVRLVGNGGGYAYGSMGATHHALEDYGLMLTLPGMHVYIPAFDSDVEPIVARMQQRAQPAYLRLGRSELQDESTLPPYAAWRRLRSGPGGLILVAGPIAGVLLQASAALAPAAMPELWAVSELAAGQPMTVPAEFLAALARAPVMAVVEEHTPTGGLGQQLLHALALGGVRLPRVVHACAAGYPSGRYGSQDFHRRESGLDAAAILRRLADSAPGAVP